MKWGILVNELMFLDRLLLDCAARKEDSARPEILWLAGKYNRFCEKYSLSGRKSADELIYRRMYGREPKKSSALKIRYWRTGHYTPKTREDIHAFCRAIELDEGESLYFLQHVCMRCDRAFTEEDIPSKIYQERRSLMEEMVFDYLKIIHPGLIISRDWNPAGLDKHFRQLYYADACRYTDCADAGNGMPGEFNINYASELRRSRLLLGEIPRRTILRHIFVLCAPFLSESIVSGKLSGLGYAPLHAGNTEISGEHLDRLVLGILKLYRQRCMGKHPEDCLCWLRTTLRAMDRLCREKQLHSLRFMFFRALKESS